MKLPSVFIASSIESLEIAKSLQYSLAHEANVSIWTEGIFSPGYSIVESLINIAERTDLAIFILGSDDFLISQSAKDSQLRQNILFELGLFIGKLGSSRIIISLPENENSALPTDLIGLVQHKTNRTEIFKLTNVIIHRLKQLAYKESSERSSTSLSKQFYSCFISYSVKDRAFVEMLYKDLTEVGVPCWLDSMEMRIGENIESSLHRSIQDQDIMILILSQNSISSKWISKEMSVSLKLEEKRGKTILFPIRIDDSVFKENLSPPLNIITKRHIGDFTNWKNHPDYKKSFSHMIRDLTTISSAESKGHL